MGQSLPSHTTENHQSHSKILSGIDGLCPPSCMIDPNWFPPSRGDEFLDCQFNFFELDVALESKNEGSACGMNGIDYLVSKALPVRYKLILVDILNEMFATGNFPLEWKKSFIHFIGKSGRVGDGP